MKDLKRNSPADQALLDRIGGELVVHGLSRVALHGRKTVTVDTHKRAPPGKGSSAPFSGGKGACTSECLSGDSQVCAELRQARNGLWQMCGSLRGSRTVVKAEEALPQPRAHVLWG